MARQQQRASITNLSPRAGDRNDHHRPRRRRTSRNSWPDDLVLLVALSARRGRLVQFYGLPFTDTSLPTLIFIHNQLITAAEWRKERAATLNE